MDVSTLAKRKLNALEEYLDLTEEDYLNYYGAPRVSFKDWYEREDPCDPDTDA